MNIYQDSPIDYEDQADFINDNLIEEDEIEDGYVGDGDTGPSLTDINSYHTK